MALHGDVNIQFVVRLKDTLKSVKPIRNYDNRTSLVLKIKKFF